MSTRSTQEEIIFEEAVKRVSQTDRAAFLEEACLGNSELRARMQLLLEGYFKAGGFLNWEPESQPGGEAIGTLTGRYKLLERIGEGGFGVVYLAEQKEPVKRHVALKVIKLGMDTKEVVARFEAERQVLALMEHANIAKVHDGGVTEGGRPFFVMELIRGVPITKYCDENDLSIQERLALFIQVCQAVQHAHQKGIIHRDLKPSNILVIVNDGAAVPKVIDFGVAKATQQQLTEKTILTQFHHLIGTPAYMSPEQAAMRGVDIDTRSDIYSLGVLLYELLTGNTPFDGKELLASGVDEMRRTIREKEPERPSTRLRKRGACKSPIVNRGLQIDSDLDWIVVKCLEKDRNRRYETANALATDINHHLDSEPVMARPPSVGYRFQKFVRRNKLALGTGVTIVTALLLGVVMSSLQAVRARKAEQQQRLERGRAENRLNAAMKFFDTAFNSVSPALSDVIGAARPRELLANAAAETLDALQQGEIPDSHSRKVIGQLYLQLALSHGWFTGNTTGDFETAYKAATNAIQLLESAAMAAPSANRLTQLFYAEQAAGIICLGLLRLHESIEHFEKCQELAERLDEYPTHSSRPIPTLRMKRWATGNIGEVLLRLGRSEEALTNFFLPQSDRLRQEGNIDESSDVWDLWDLGMTHHNVAAAYQRLGQPQKAAVYFRDALRTIEILNRRQAHSAQFSCALAVHRAELGEVLLCLNQPEEGLKLLQEAAHLADELARRDPANAGFTQVQIEVAWHSAAGCAVWAREGSASPTEGKARLKQAQAFLDRAQKLVSTLKSATLQRFLAADLRPVKEKVEEVSAGLEGPQGHF
jgi:tetratricopeptide (TPR) repeat protein/predicted Ser/Thr protein kinase